MNRDSIKELKSKLAEAERAYLATCAQPTIAAIYAASIAKLKRQIAEAAAQ